jgi:clan AA aspartic protease (TIGR02281 family)
MRCKPTTLTAFLVVSLWSPISARAVEIPLGESGGVYTVPVQVNQSVTLQFLVDPGAAIVVIPRSVLNRLVANGTVTQDDIIGLSVAELADSSAHRAIQIRLRELRVGDRVVRDVTAAVSPGLTYPLLGQTFLKRFASVTFDNQRRVLILSDMGAAPAPQYRYPSQNPTPSVTAPYYPPAPAAPASPYGYDYGYSNSYGQPGYWPPGR